MSVAVAFCPCPPVLVSDVAAGAAAELDDLRTSCAEAVETVTKDTPRRVLVVGGGDPPGRWGAEAGGSMRRYGKDVHCGGLQDDLPLSLTIGAHLLDLAGWTGDRAYVAVAGHETLDADAEVAWLVMADGTAKRTGTSPGYVDERALGWDAVVAHALAEGDSATLAGLDLAVASDLWCDGAPAWKVAGRSLAGRRVGEARLLADQAPYGVGYLVATWMFLT